MAHSLSIDWWRRPAAATEAAAMAPGAAAEPQGGRTAFWALVVFTFVLIFVPQQYLPFLSALRINLLVAVIALAAHVIAPPKSKAMRFPLELKLAIGLAVCAAVSIPTSYWRSASVDAFADYLKVVVIFWLIGQDVCSLKRVRVLLWTLALVCVPIAVTALRNYATGAFIGGDRIMGYSNNLAENPNDLALILNLFLPLTAALALTARRLSLRLFAWGLVGLSVAAVIITFSRGGFLTLMVEAALFLPLLIRRGGGKVIGILAIVAIVGVSLAPAGYTDRMGTILNIESDSTGSAQMRWDDTVASFAFMLRHPILGAGLGQGLLALNEIRGALWTTVHNAYLNYGVDTGVVGFVLFIAMVLVSLRTARRIERLPDGTVPGDLKVLATGVRISLAGFAVAAFFHPIGYDFYFFYLAGIAVAMKATAVRQFGARVPA
jgi:O-antigen ligase